ncbi:hypothetical protein PV10_01364 [Exophiala mesophila]|uniref:F-box domain-containing protein n=1 Tax=Exophiala mesophila TaxID=212818 RepID=A0A0D1X726_EXOME|nr:uncharacterized protein PV10_01364 [Exophiala mesophila]KIV97645.1 hypothetical protein PV10_01364 [Exophiala mesophila]
MNPNNRHEFLYSSHPPQIASQKLKRTSGVSFALPTTSTQSLPSNIPHKPLKYTFYRQVLTTRAAITWTRLPATILHRVLEWLKISHLDHESRSCSTCYMRDLSAVQRSCKAWHSVAQRILYSDIQLVGPDDDSMLRRWNLPRAARLARLRSTLRADSLIATLVTSIHVSDPHIPLYTSGGDPNPDYDSFLCVLASVVMECPNLEALTGFYPFYNHTFDRLTQALSTRSKLKQHVWVIAENDDVTARSQTQLPPGLLDHYQVDQFLHYHDRWTNLETLMLCSPASLGVVEHQVLIDVLHCLPSLAHLGLCSLDGDDFHDATLLSLPALKSLRLEECTGVTEAGLTRWAASPRAFHLERLSLMYQQIENLLSLSKLLASLECLTKLTIVQPDTLLCLNSHDQQIIVQPILFSRSLKFLHWDVSRQKGADNSARSSFQNHHSFLEANDHLALSIQHQGFPSLAHLRVPSDIRPYGLLQSICLPTAVSLDARSRDQDGLDHFHKSPYSRSLQVARVRAQRIALTTKLQERLPSVASTRLLNSTTTLWQDALPLPNPEKPPSPPPRSPLRPQRAHDRNHNDVGSIRGEHTEDLTPICKFQRPRLYLKPDVSGRDHNGGLVGWAELLGIREKGEAFAKTPDTIASPSGTAMTSLSGLDLDDCSDVESDYNIGTTCSGWWNRQPGKSFDSDDTSTVRRILTSSPQIYPRLKRKTVLSAPNSKSSSRIGFTSSSDDRVGASTRFWNHVPRPRGDRGGDVLAVNFF